MESIKLEAHLRETGKKAARRVRREGLVPCVLYGPQTAPVVFAVSELDMRPLIYTNETHRVELALNGDQWSCILKDVDFHPVTDYPIHADFQVLTAGQLITLTVPVRYEGIPVGQTDGGDTQFVLTEVEIRCVPENIPGHIAVDISELQIGDSIHVADLEREGIEFISPARQTLVTVVPPSMEVLEEEEAEEAALLEGEEEIAEEGEEADTAEDEADEEGAGAAS